MLKKYCISALTITFIFLSLNLNAQNIDRQIDLYFFDHSNDIVELNDSILKRTEYWTNLKLDHKFFVVDSASFNRNQVLTLNANYHKYMEHTMSLKFYSYKDLHVRYKPTLVKKHLLYSSDGYLYSIKSKSGYSNKISSAYNIRKKNEEFFIQRPYLVKHVWKTIPEPHRLITDRKYLTKRSATEGLASILSGKIDSPEKLDKRIKKKGPWTYSGVENIQLSQTYLENWSKGGENSVTLGSDLLLKANYKKNKTEWENFVRHKVGVVSTESYATQINNDQILANSKYGLRASKKWYYSFVFDFKSQFFNGYNNKERESIISGFLSPAYFTFALGMDFKKSKDFTLLLSPLTSKITYVMDTAKVDQTRYKVPEERKAAFNNGASLVNNINWKISTELSLKSQLDAFVGYLNKDAITQIDWELIFDMRINRFLSTRINTQLKYFTNESDKIQFREYFAINFNYKF